jgi:hypothetical protein
MKSHHILAKTVSLALSLLIPFGVYLAIDAKYDNVKWLVPLFSGLSALFTFDVWNHFSGKEKYWNVSLVRDKVVFFVSMVVFLSCISLPLKLGLSDWALILFILTGALFSEIGMYFLGSQTMKKKIIWYKLKKHP